MTDDTLAAAMQALRLAARRSSVARRLDADAEQALLQTIVEATVALFEAEAAIRAARVQRDSERLLRAVLAAVGGDGIEEAQVEALVSAATADLDTDTESPFWRLVDRVAELRELSDRELSLVSDILDVVAAHGRRDRRSSS